MDSTKFYLSKFLTIFIPIATVVAGLIAAFAFQPGNQMVNYYCVLGNPFIGLQLQGFAACPVYISIGYTIFITSAFFAIGLLVSIIIDLIRNNTEKTFQLNANEPIEKEPNAYRWASVKVTNISGEIIKNCFIDLEDVLDVNGKSILKIKRKRKLSWSYGDPPRNANKDISPHEQKVIDVATTAPENKNILFETQAGQETHGKGVYEVIIVANGEINEKPKRKRSSFIMEYSGGNVLTIINKGSKNWSNPDPRPPKVPKSRKTLKLKDSDSFTPSS